MIENKNEKLGWINGHWGICKDLKVPIIDRGLNFADGIFETILILNGIPQFLNEHLNRWEKSAKILEMNSPPSKKWLISLIDEGINRSKLNNKNGVIRLNLSRGDNQERGIDINDSTLNRFWLEINYCQLNFDSISTMISQLERRNKFSRLSSCKTFAYNQAIQARLEAKKAGYDDALLLNTDGFMCCGTTANIIVKRKNIWLTPSLDTGCLPGIMRQRAIDLGILKVCNINLVPEDEDEWFLINSLSCRKIQRINNKYLRMSTHPKHLWWELLNTRKTN